MFTLANLNRPVIQILNNGQLSGVRAMPQKDSTSNNESTFEMNRAVYSRTLPTNPTTNYMNGKKWYGNRDASQVTTNRRTSEVGIGSLNATNGPMSFESHANYNTTRDALRRVRAGGAVAPAKKGANRNNAPVPGFSPAIPHANSLVTDLFGIKRPVLFH
jgi:hypothetical protein